MLVGDWKASTPLAEFVDGLPDVLAVRRMRLLARSLLKAGELGATRLLMYGGHVIKCGLGPLLVRWLRRGVVDSLATSGAGTIHDLELALYGGTSEDVRAGIADGSFGMWEETGLHYARAVEMSADRDIGLGHALGSLILEEGGSADASPLAASVKLEVPVTVHPALGGDIVHPHPGLDWARLGRAAERDFDALVQRCSELSGGVVINLGSAVVMPEAFLKALTTAQNLGAGVTGITACNMDMIQHYRPDRNVVGRPVEALGGDSVSLTGHHELMLPLLDAFVKSEEAR
jgi:hypothetical protein